MIKKLYSLALAFIRTKEIRAMVRIGFVVRGIVYVIMGFLGLRLSMGIETSLRNPQDIVISSRNLPLGAVIVTLLVLGFIGYGVRGFILATSVKGQKKPDTASYFQRLGYLISAFSYLGLAWIGLTLLTPFSQWFKIPSQSMIPDFLFASRLGNILLVFIGSLVVVGGFAQILYGLRGRFLGSLAKEKMGAKQKKLISMTGRYGIAARGVMYLLIGMFFVRAGWWSSPGQPSTLKDILGFIQTIAAGPLILAMFSLGLIALGVYSVLASRVTTIPRGRIPQ